MSKKIRLVDLSQPFGDKCPLWPYFQDVKIERMHYHAKSGVLSQVITTTMHCTTHADSPAHVFEGGQYTDEIPLEKYYGTGVVVDIPKGKWGVITAEDLENACPKIEKDDIVIVHTGWHKKWGDSTGILLLLTGPVQRSRRVVCSEGRQSSGRGSAGPGSSTGNGYRPPWPWRTPQARHSRRRYKRETGREVKEDFPHWEPCHNLLLRNGIMGWENVGGDLEQVVGKRVTISGFPIRWQKGDGSIVRLVAIVEEED